MSNRTFIEEGKGTEEEVDGCHGCDLRHFAMGL